MRAAKADTPIHAGPATTVTKASRKPSLPSLAGSTEPGATASRQAMNATITANCATNHATTPAAPHAIVPSGPHGGGATADDAAAGVGKGSWLMVLAVVQGL